MTMREFWASRRTVQLWAMVLGFYTFCVGAVFWIDGGTASTRLYLWRTLADLATFAAHGLSTLFMVLGAALFIAGMREVRHIPVPSLLVVGLWGFTISVYFTNLPQSFSTILIAPLPSIASAVAIRIRSKVVPVPPCRRDACGLNK